MTGIPTIGKTHTLNLDGAKPNAKALLAIGSKRTNVDLGFIGAPQCWLLTDTLIVLGSATNSAGAIRMPQPVPNIPGLIGISVTQQFAIVDSVNKLGLAFSDGLEIRIGK